MSIIILTLNRVDLHTFFLNLQQYFVTFEPQILRFMIIDKEYPATHSMDTSWFAIDLDGNVAILNFDDNGPVPTLASSDNSACSVVTEVLAEKSNELPYPCLEFSIEEINEIINNSRPFKDNYGEINFFDTLVKVKKDKLDDFCEVAKALDVDTYETICLNKEECFFYVNWYSDDAEKNQLVRKLINDKTITVLCKLNFWCGDNDDEEEIELKGFPFYVYRQNYDPRIPIRRTQSPKFIFKEDRLSIQNRHRALRLPIRFDENKSFQTAMYTPCSSYSDTVKINDKKYSYLRTANDEDVLIARNSIYNMYCGRSCRKCFENKQKTDKWDSDYKLTFDRQYCKTPTILIITDLTGINYNDRISNPLIIKNSVVIPIIEGVPCQSHEETYKGFKELSEYPIKTYFQNCRLRLEKNINFFKPQAILVYKNILPYLSEVYHVEDDKIVIGEEEYPLYIWENLENDRDTIQRLAQLDYRGEQIEWVVPMTEELAKQMEW